MIPTFIVVPVFVVVPVIIYRLLKCFLCVRTITEFYWVVDYKGDDCVVTIKINVKG
jgi:hypothetical protein